MNADKYITKINKAKNRSEANKILLDAMADTNKGLFNIGVSDNDQRAIVKVIESYGSKYNKNMGGLLDVWDPGINSINSFELKKVIANSKKYLDHAKDSTSYSKNSTNYSKNPVNYSRKPINSSPAKLPGPNQSPLRPPVSTSISSSRPSSPNRGGGYYGNSGSNRNNGNNKAYESIINDLKKEIDTLKHPKVYTASELANIYGITDQYDYNNILKQYNEATNKYYDDAIAEQEVANNLANEANTMYANNLINSYLDSYKNQAATVGNKNINAANVLASSLMTDQTTGDAATNLNSLVNNYQEQRKAELASNPINARTDYNNIGSWLLQQGANLNASDVQNYIDTLNAYATKYDATRKAQQSLADVAAQTYQNNAAAALANNTYNNQMKDYKYYQYWYGDKAPTVYSNVKTNRDNKYIGY